MKKSEVLAMLADNKNERGVQHWEKRGKGSSELESYGIGLTQLRKMAKGIGRDHRLAQQLWKTKLYEARVLSLLIDDPKVITREQVESQVEDLAGGHLAHVFSACGATLARAPFVRELADDWMMSEDPVRRGCGFGLLYEISKSKKKSAPEEDYFLQWVDHIRESYPEEGTDVLMSMATALMGIGKRSRRLNAAALEVASKIGPIDFDPTGKCDPMDIVKHLTGPYARDKLGLK